MPSDLPPIKPTEAWFVVDEETGFVQLKSGASSRTKSIHAFCGPDPVSWKLWKERGFSCRKLLIAERGGER